MGCYQVHRFKCAANNPLGVGVLLALLIGMGSLTWSQEVGMTGRLELGLRAFLEAGGFKGFTTTFEDLRGLRQLPGLAMQLSASSRPASGSEHRFSHLWEMQLGPAAALHGFKVGVGTIAAAALYERLLARELTRLDIERLCRTWPSRAEVERAVRQGHDHPQLAEHAVAESLAKYINARQLRQRLLLLQERWPTLREQLQAQLMPAMELRSLLHAAGCPTAPTGIGVSWSQLRASYNLARTIRSRYTGLDLAAETGLTSECVEELFAPGGFWAHPPTLKSLRPGGADCQDLL